MFSKLVEGGLRNIRKQGKVVSVNQEAAEEFVQEFSDYRKAAGFLSQQVFNCDKTHQFWNKMPRTYITRGESITGTQANKGQTDYFAIWKHKWGVQD